MSWYTHRCTLARVQRVSSVASGEQVLLSNACAELAREALPADCLLTDLGDHHLKGFEKPERLWQVGRPGLRSSFAPLPSTDTRQHNLPRFTTRFIGRAREIDECRRLLETGRLVTLTGIGGAGKNRFDRNSTRIARQPPRR